MVQLCPSLAREGPVKRLRPKVASQLVHTPGGRARRRARWRSLTSRSRFEPQLAETEHVRYVRKPTKHLQRRPATLTKARCHADGNKLEELTAPGRIFTAKPAETKDVREVRKLAKHLQRRPAAVAEARRHAQGNELGEPARWKMVGRGFGWISPLKQVVHACRNEVRGLSSSKGICHESSRACPLRLAAFFPLSEHLHSTNFDLPQIGFGRSTGVEALRSAMTMHGVSRVLNWYNHWNYSQGLSDQCSRSKNSSCPGLTYAAVAAAGSRPIRPRQLRNAPSLAGGSPGSG